MHLEERIAVPVVREADDVAAVERTHRSLPFRFRSLDVGRAGRGRARRMADLVLAEPELVHPERVQLFLAIAHASLVVVEEAHERLLAEAGAGERIASQERFAERLVELLLEPARGR